MAPVMLAAPLSAEGRLVELPPQKRIAVTLYWQRPRLASHLLDPLTPAVREVAAAALNPNARDTGHSETD